MEQYDSYEGKPLLIIVIVALSIYPTLFLVVGCEFILRGMKIVPIKFKEMDSSSFRSFIYFTSLSYFTILVVIISIVEFHPLIFLVMIFALIFVIINIVILCKFCRKCPTDLLESRFVKHLFLIPWKYSNNLLSCSCCIGDYCHGLHLEGDEGCFGCCVSYLLIIAFFIAFIGTGLAFTLTQIILYYCGLLIFMIFWLPIFWCCGVKRKDNNENNNNNKENVYTLFVYESEVTLNIADEKGGNNSLLTKKTTRVIVTKDTK